MKPIDSEYGIHDIVNGMSRYIEGLWLAVNFKTILVASFSGFLMQLIQQYIFKDWQYLKFLLIVFLLDTFYGIWRRVKEGTFNFNKLWDIVAKVFVYAGFLIVGHVLSYFTVNGEVAGYGYVANGFYIMLLLFESRSALRNIGAIYPSLAIVQYLENKISQLIEAKQQKVNSL